VNISVVVDDDHADDLDRVSARLRASGMAVDAVLEEVGIITGSARRQDLAAVQVVEGVASVTTDSQLIVPPPESDLR
jgi:hypothetical protein